jgi:hypothetical protein
VFLNESPIAWYSKKQTRVENSEFGSEFIAMRTELETVQGIRYKLRMMGVPLTTSTYIYGDNMSVIYNTSRPESTLKKKANSVCYHFIREAVAADECRTVHISTHENPADVFYSKRDNNNNIFISSSCDIISQPQPYIQKEVCKK